MKKISLCIFLFHLSLTYCAPGNLEIDDLEESELQLRSHDFDKEDSTIWKTLFQPQHGKASVSSNIKVFKVKNDAFGKTLFDEVSNTVDVDDVENTNEIRSIKIPQHKLKPSKFYRRHSISKRSVGRGVDYVNKGRALSKGRGLGAGGGIIEVEVEVGVVFDYANSKLFNFDHAKIVEYLSILLNGVNTIYTNLQNPKIHFVLTGVYIIKDEKSQPFMAQSKSENKSSNAVDLMKLLDNYSIWVKKNLKTLPKHDVIPLITAVTPETFNFGLAYLAGACWEVDEAEDKAMTTSISIDTNGIFEAVFTLAHEMGHNLGAPHDGDAPADSCPWSDGFVMSYEGWLTKNKFQFSECSKTLIKEFVQSPAANCLFKKNADKHEKMSTKYDGEVITPGDLCKHLTGDPSAILVQDDVEKFCKVVRCEFTEKGKKIWRTYERPPAINKFPCGIGGHCLMGECVGNKQSPNDDLDLNKKCQTLTHNPNAMLYPEDDANDQCKRVKCKVPGATNGTFTITTFNSKVPDHSFPCGLLGHCMNGACEGNKEHPEDKLNLNKVCAKRTGKPDAVYSSEGLKDAEICKVIRCKIPGATVLKYNLMTFSNSPLDGSFPCKDDKGKCFKGACVVKE